MFFGVPGTLGNKFKTLKGIRFSHFGGPAWRDDFKARLGGYLLWICTIFETFWVPSGECFVTKRWKHGVWKNKRKSSRIFSCGNYNWLQLIPGLAPCGPLKELKKSAIPPGLAPRWCLKSNWQSATGNWYHDFSLETLPWCPAGMAADIYIYICISEVGGLVRQAPP